ncbi:MAG: methylated-DNA--[protein]-cysteine S-methyltransferase [Chitinophagaceae bacterium]|jgi:methylated-DNA-[protein]-cysteine S-methyltransferase|nr:methylated-DNA--[protein]-cysteine S-methyltransferase [Chitinophagaceae bacterium]
MSVYTTCYHSPIGKIKISGTTDYISEVIFADDDVPTIVLSEQLPPLLIDCTEQLIQYFQGERRFFELPLNQQGTLFQQEVWTELMSIAYAKTVSYINIARRTGDPKATRAVANANAKNNLCIIVPCHRVIGANNELTGYSGGIWRKKWLLEHEKKIAFGIQTLF